MTAQAERLRFFRENIGIGEQFIAWFAFFAVGNIIVATFVEGARGWPFFRSIVADEVAFYISFGGMALISLVFAIVITIRLVLGLSIGVTTGGGHYPRYVAYARAARRRTAKRVEVEKRANVARADRERERKSEKRRPHRWTER